MGAAKFQEYLHKHFKRARKSIETFEQSKNPADLFLLRTSIKRLRVCLACIEYFQGRRFKEVRRRLKLIFREGGHVREMDIYREWLKKHRYKNILAVIIKEDDSDESLQHFLKKTGQSNHELKRMEKQFLDQGKKLDQWEIGEFYVALIRSNLPVPFGRPPQKEWHALRKNLKRIVYARKWQDGVHLKLVSQRQSDWLNKLQRLFGDWHDNEMMVRWMNTKARSKKYAAFKEDMLQATREMKTFSKNQVPRIRQMLSSAPTMLKPLQKRLEELKTLSPAAKRQRSHLLRAV